MRRRERSKVQQKAPDDDSCAQSTPSRDIFLYCVSTAPPSIWAVTLDSSLRISAFLGYSLANSASRARVCSGCFSRRYTMANMIRAKRSEEHTSELQSQSNLVCRLLLEKKKNKKNSR